MKQSSFSSLIWTSQARDIDMIIHGVAQYLCGIQMIKCKEPDYEIDMKQLRKEIAKCAKNRNLPKNMADEVFDCILKIAKDNSII